MVVSVTAEGAVRLTDEEVGAVAEAVVAGRAAQRPAADPATDRPAPAPLTCDVPRSRRRDDADLRLTRAVHARPLGVRPQGHRPRSQRRGRSPSPAACCSSPRTTRRRCTRSARSTTGSGSPRSAGTTSSRTCARPASGWPTSAASPTTAATSPAVAGQRLRPDRRVDLLRAPEAVRGRAVRRRGRRARRRATSCTGSPTTVRSSTSARFVVMGGATEPDQLQPARLLPGGASLADALGAGRRRPSATPTRR